MSEGFNVSAITAKNKVRLTSRAEVSLEGVSPQENLTSSTPVTATAELQVMKTEMEQLKEALKLTQEIRQEIERAYNSLFPEER